MRVDDSQVMNIRVDKRGVIKNYWKNLEREKIQQDQPTQAILQAKILPEGLPVSIQTCKELERHHPWTLKKMKNKLNINQLSWSLQRNEVTGKTPF